MRQHHVHTLMVMIAMALATSTALLVSTTTPSYAAPRNVLSIRAADVPTDTILLPNQTDIIVERFILRAGREDLFIDTLSFDNCSTESIPDYDGDCADTGETAGNDAAISTIALLYNDGTYNRKTRGTLIDGRVTFSHLALTLPAGVDVPVDVRVTTGAIDAVAVTSGAQFQINLNAITAPFHGVTASNGTEITELHAKKHVIGSSRTLRQTLATLALSSTAPSGSIADDWSEAFRVNVRASSTGDVTLDALTLALAIVNNGRSNWNTCPFLGAREEHFALVDTATGLTMPATWGIYDDTGITCTLSGDTVGYLHATFTTPVVIAANTTVSIAFYLDATYANPAYHDILQVTIPTEDDLTELSTELHAITWSDGTTSGTSLDGSDIGDLPVNGNILVF